jgi:hypothetical protein
MMVKMKWRVVRRKKGTADIPKESNKWLPCKKYLTRKGKGNRTPEWGGKWSCSPRQQFDQIEK